MAEQVRPQRVHHTREEAEARSIPGASVMCTTCGTYGAVRRWDITIVSPGTIALCAADNALVDEEIARHKEALAELVSIRFREPQPARTKTAPKDWRESLHATEVRALAQRLGWTAVPTQHGHGYELRTSSGGIAFKVSFNSRSEFHSATGSGTAFVADYRSHAHRSTPRQLLNMFKEYVEKLYAKE